MFIQCLCKFNDPEKQYQHVMHCFLRIYNKSNIYICLSLQLSSLAPISLVPPSFGAPLPLLPFGASLPLPVEPVRPAVGPPPPSSSVPPPLASVAPLLQA